MEFYVHNSLICTFWPINFILQCNRFGILPMHTGWILSPPGWDCLHELSSLAKRHRCLNDSFSKLITALPQLSLLLRRIRENLQTALPRPKASFLLSVSGHQSTKSSDLFLLSSLPEKCLCLKQIRVDQHFLSGKGSQSQPIRKFRQQKNNKNHKLLWKFRSSHCYLPIHLCQCKT